MVQGALFAGGAAALQISAGAGRIDFFWTPLILGVVYLLAAVVDGPLGGYWATALGLTGWGLSVALMGELRPVDVDVAGAYLVGAGLAVAAAALLRSRGYAVSDAGLGLTIIGGGLALALSPRSDALVDATTYAIGLAVVAAVNLALGARGLAQVRALR